MVYLPQSNNRNILELSKKVIANHMFQIKAFKNRTNDPVVQG